MDLNIAAIAVAAIVPLVFGAIWYNPNVFGKAWLKASGLTDEQARGANMAVVFGLTLLFGFLFAFALSGMVIHQSAVFSLVVSNPDFADPASEVSLWYADFAQRFATDGRTFGHGAFHGVIVGLFVVLPIIGVQSLFERKGGRYIWIHTGYWVVSLAIMGGIIAAWI